MKIGILLALFSICCFTASAQQTNSYNLVQLLQQNKLVTTPAQQTQVLANAQKQAITTKGIVWLKDVDFNEGTMDVDLRGKDVFLESFMGIAFHAADTGAYELIYFRPFNFRHADTLRRRWSVQYVSLPGYGWDVLRKAHPLMYENAVDPAPRADEWFHATIVVKDNWVTVYVDHSPKASLKVKMLRDRKGGMVGLWDDGLSGDFANLIITK